MAQGISNQGRDAEALFVRLVRGSRKIARAAAGDAEVDVDGITTSIEIKKCDAPGQSGTINQVRAIKFIPLVVYNPTQNCWYVVPATELARFAASKARGQHTEISFESMNLSLKSILKWVCSAEHLDDAVRRAIRFDREHRGIQQALDALLRELKTLGAQRRQDIARLLEAVPIWRLE